MLVTWAGERGRNAKEEAYTRADHEGSAGIDRDVQADLEPDQTPQFAGLQTAGTTGSPGC
jgi:hypothetical protein